MSIVDRLERRGKGVLRAVRERDPRSPGRAVPARYAGILDGEHLWLALEATEGGIALRHRDSGRLVRLDPDLEDRTDGELSLRADLSAVRDRTPATYDVVLALGGGKLRPVHLDALPETALRTPPTRDERHQFTLHRAEDGELSIEVNPTSQAATLVATQVVPDGLEVVVDGAPDGAQLLVRSDDGEVRGRFPMAVEDGRARGTVTVDGLPATGEPFAKLAVGDDRSSLLVRRRHNGLRAPTSAAILPELLDDDEQPTARLRWSPNGLLAIRLFRLEPDADEADA